MISTTAGTDPSRGHDVEFARFGPRALVGEGSSVIRSVHRYLERQP
jgi:hypothetical protein